MAKAMKLKQLSFSLPNRVGLLAHVASAVSQAKVNIEAICAYEMDDKGFFMLVTDNNAKAKKALAKMGANVEVEDVLVVVVPNKVGQLQSLAMKIADAGVDIYYAYGSPGAVKTTCLVFKTANDAKALKAINT
ncbi:MAG TPA: ACT domain-containing protein [Syntrophales bacterium]